MVELGRLFGRGLKWSYNEYGLKGAVAFVLLAGLLYYVISSRLESLFEEETAEA